MRSSVQTYGNIFFLLVENIADTVCFYNCWEFTQCFFFIHEISFEKFSGISSSKTYLPKAWWPQRDVIIFYKYYFWGYPFAMYKKFNFCWNSILICITKDSISNKHQKGLKIALVKGVSKDPSRPFCHCCCCCKGK